MRTELINELISEYKADPNCWPALWIKGEGLTTEETELFLKEVKSK